MEVRVHTDCMDCFNVTIQVGRDNKANTICVLSARIYVPTSPEAPDLESTGKFLKRVAGHVTCDSDLGWLVAFPLLGTEPD